jgi:hypothetical protein
MIISWIRKLFVKTSPVEPEAVAVEASPVHQQAERKKRGRPFGSKNKGKLVSQLKVRPKIRKGERPSNFTARLQRWEARNDSAKAKSNQRPVRPGVSPRRQKDSDQS